jgi:hypothetical protein
VDADVVAREDSAREADVLLLLSLVLGFSPGSSCQQARMQTQLRAQGHGSHDEALLQRPRSAAFSGICKVNWQCDRRGIANLSSFSFAKKHAIYGYAICFDSVISILLSHTRAGCSSSFEIFRVFLRLFQMCAMLPMCSCVSVVLLHIKLPGSKLCWRLPCAFERNIARILSVHAATKSECIDAHKARMLSRKIPMLATHF